MQIPSAHCVHRPPDASTMVQLAAERPPHILGSPGPGRHRWWGFILLRMLSDTTLLTHCPHMRLQAPRVPPCRARNHLTDASKLYVRHWGSDACMWGSWARWARWQEQAGDAVTCGLCACRSRAPADQPHQRRLPPEPHQRVLLLPGGHAPGALHRRGHQHALGGARHLPV